MTLNLSHKKLKAWQKGMILLKHIYQITNQFPPEEKFLLRQHVRKTAISVVSNIAEGAARRNSKEKIRFYEIARSSLVELDTQLDISNSLGYLKEQDNTLLSSILGEVFALITGLIKSRGKNLLS